jgi:hypothetical protein
MVFGWLRRRKKEEDFPTEITTSLPDDLERFRTRTTEVNPAPTGNYGKPLDLVGITESGIESKDKLDLILQKLETIDVRLKLLEEKLRI